MRRQLSVIAGEMMTLVIIDMNALVKSASASPAACLACRRPMLPIIAAEATRMHHH